MAGSPYRFIAIVLSALEPSCHFLGLEQGFYSEFDGEQEEGPAGTSGEAQVDSQPLGQVASPNVRISPQQK
ncbi:hypothetical protein E4U59_003369, partial [Claviceps monticola]